MKPTFSSILARVHFLEDLLAGCAMLPSVFYRVQCLYRYIIYQAALKTSDTCYLLQTYAVYYFLSPTQFYLGLISLKTTKVQYKFSSLSHFSPLKLKIN